MRLQVVGYFTHRMGLDGRAQEDYKAIEKARQLLNSNRLNAISFLASDTDKGEEVYLLSSICGAAMKTAVSTYF